MEISIWHLAVNKDDLMLFLQIWEWGKKKLTTEEINKFFSVTDHKGRTVWHVTIKCSNRKIFQQVWQYAKENLPTQELKKQFVVSHRRRGKDRLMRGCTGGQPGDIERSMGVG